MLKRPKAKKKAEPKGKKPFKGVKKSKRIPY